MLSKTFGVPFLHISDDVTRVLPFALAFRSVRSVRLTLPFAFHSNTPAGVLPSRRLRWRVWRVWCVLCAPPTWVGGVFSTRPNWWSTVTPLEIGVCDQ